MAGLNYETCEIVYVCCAEYLVPTKSADAKGVRCPRCGKLLNVPIAKPNIVLVKCK